MKKYFIILLILAAKSYSQTSSDKGILRLVLEVGSNLPNVVFKQSEGYKKIETIISRKTIFNKITPEIKIDLTDDEISLIKSEINKGKGFVFSQDLFPNEVLISIDTVKSYCLNQEEIWKKERDAVYESKDTIKIAKFRNEKPFPCAVTSISLFSKPVYFRNNTLCILYYANLCDFNHGVGGCEEIYICKNTNGMWEKYIVIPIGCY